MAQFPLAVGGGATDGPTTTSNVVNGIRALSAGGTANTKGSYLELVTATAQDSDWMLVMFAPATSNTSHLLDIAVGPAGSEVVIAENIHTSLGNNSSEWFLIPGNIPAGTRVAARSQCSTASSQLRVAVVRVKGGFFSPQGGGRLTTYGANTADSGGTPINAGASAGTFGAWAQLTASTSRAAHGMALRTGGINNTTPTTGQGIIQIGVGGAGSETPLFDIPFQVGTALDNYGPMPPFIFPCEIPAGARLAARWMYTSTDAVDRVIDVVAYALEA